MPMSLSRMFAALVVLALAGCASTPPQVESAAAPAAKEPTAAELLDWAATTGGSGVSRGVIRPSREIQLPEFTVQRRYDTVFREDGKDIGVTVEYGWNYARGVAVKQVFLRDGTPYRQSELPGTTLRASNLEMELAYSLAREYPALNAALTQPGLFFYGGFAYYQIDDPGCGRGSRCVHVIVSRGSNSEIPVAHAIVDLMQRRVVHPFSGPHEHEATAQQLAQ